MKKNVVADVMEGTLTMTKAFYKKAGVVGSREYYELRKAMKENEGFEIVFKGADKRTYKGLTFEKMADYIRTQPNSKERLIEFASVQAVAETKNANLISIMTRQEISISNILYGSYAHQIILRSRIPILTIRPLNINSLDQENLGT